VLPDEYEHGSQGIPETGGIHPDRPSLRFRGLHGLSIRAR